MRVGNLIALLLILPIFVNACNIEVINYTTNTTASPGNSITYDLYVTNNNSNTANLIFTTNSPYNYEIRPLTAVLPTHQGKLINFKVFIPASASNGQKQINFNAINTNGNCTHETTLPLYISRNATATNKVNIADDALIVTNWPNDLTVNAGETIDFGFVLKNNSANATNIDIGLNTNIKWDSKDASIYLGAYNSKNLSFTIYPTNMNSGNNTITFFAKYGGHTLQKEINVLVSKSDNLNNNTNTILPTENLTVETKDVERKIIGNNVETLFTLAIKNENNFDVVADEIKVENIPEDWKVRIERNSFMVFAGETTETKIKIIPIGEKRDGIAKINVYSASKKIGTTAIKINEELTSFNGSGLFLGAGWGVLQAILAVMGAILLIMFISNLVRRYEHERTMKEHELQKQKQDAQMRHYF